LAISTATGTVSGTITLGYLPGGGMAINASGTRAYVPLGGSGFFAVGDVPTKFAVRHVSHRWQSR
jgi:hypothetical protein